ncbi:right-handed parallel beta-helix repeat-containing protein [Candidatus Uhrbacteria bacterium]|nr:right-handed parallel beta-helix repeat-containing protein [Candidatus Uhrbacteria bacterium]
MNVVKTEARIGLIGILVILLVTALISSGCGGNEGSHRNMVTPRNLIRVPNDFPTITAALNSARYGDIVEVGGISGVYDEASGEIFPLHLKRGVTLRKGWVRSITIDMNVPMIVPMIEMESGATVEGFIFTMSSGQISYYALELQGVSDIAIRNCDFLIRRALSFDGITNLKIEGCTFYPKFPGAPRTQAIVVFNSTDIKIRNNTLSSFGMNIWFGLCKGVELTHNIVILGGNGILIDFKSSTNRFLENDVWANVVNYEDSSGAFLPTSGNNISVDPRFLDREGDDFLLSESSPCILPGGEVIGARGAPKINAHPTITKSVGSTTVMQRGRTGMRILGIELGNASTTDRVLFGPGLSIHTVLTTNMILPNAVLRMYDAYGTVVAEGTVFSSGGRTDLILSPNFPTIFKPGETKEFVFELETTATFNTGATLQLEILSMEWTYGNGSKVNDGMTPYGLPMSNTVTRP